MNVSTSSSTVANDGSYATGNPQKIRAEMQALDKALQSGDLASAQAAYTQLQTDAPWLSKASSTPSTSSSTSPSDSFASLGSALQSGDVSGAQTAFTQLQQSIRGHRGHHRRDQDGDAGASAANAQAQNFRDLASALLTGNLGGAQSAFSSIQGFLSPNGTNGTTPSPDGTDPLQTLATALQSGDLSGAQNAFAAMLQTQNQQNGISLYAPDGSNDFSGGLGGTLIDTSA
ncbi:MAG TPA: hypothetical protein VHE61_10720 [Opitutaceae bacterium]|nr:hypothetical protein [Opitutaceae bacterium]